MYESFYLRAVAPDEPVGAWIRHTVHKRPGDPPRGSVWCTLFDASRGAPFMHKVTSDVLQVPSDGWIAIGEQTQRADGGDRSASGASFAPGRAQGASGPARWSLSFTARDGELRHLSRELFYRAPVPRTKLTSPAPGATFTGVIEVDGRTPLQLREWPGMVGHNWGSEHAERWIWLHGVGFEEAPEAWIDLALGRVKLANRLTPWIANGALSLGGSRYRLGGLGARGLRVAETAGGCALRLPGERGLTLELRAEVPAGTAAGWRYADPDGSEHDVVNCSIAAMQLTVKLPGERMPLSLRTDHGGAYELGMRERDHGVAIAPFPDG
jgi:hypothetical protein